MNDPTASEDPASNAESDGGEDEEEEEEEGPDDDEKAEKSEEGEQVSFAWYCLWKWSSGKKKMLDIGDRKGGSGALSRILISISSLGTPDSYIPKAEKVQEGLSSTAAMV